MRAVLALVSLTTSTAFGHPGHGAPVGHMHSWDWGQLLTWVVILAIAGLAIWKAK